MLTEPLKIKHVVIKAEIHSSEVCDTTMDFPKASLAKNHFYKASKQAERGQLQNASKLQ